MYKTLLDIRTFDMWFMSPYLIASICAWISIKSGLGSRAFLWRPPWPLGGWTQLRRTFPDGLPEEDDKIRSNGPKGTSIYYVSTLLNFWPLPTLLHPQIFSWSQRIWKNFSKGSQYSTDHEHCTKGCWTFSVAVLL